MRFKNINMREKLMSAPLETIGDKAFWRLYMLINKKIAFLPSK